MHEYQPFPKWVYGPGGKTDGLLVQEESEIPEGYGELQEAVERQERKKTRKPPSQMNKDECRAELIEVHDFDPPDKWKKAQLQAKVKELRG
jgi:hypothetical protein